MSRLLLVRHGESEYNIARRFAGHLDVGLSAAGMEQAEKLRRRLAIEQIDTVYCSDLKRAVTTAEIAVSGRGLKIVACPELREFNYGLAEGLRFDEIKRLYPGVAEMCINFSPQLAFPQGESFSCFAERTGGFLQRLNGTATTTLIVSHSGPTKVLLCRLLGLDYKHWGQLRLDNASLSIIEVMPNRTSISLLNDVSHLK